MNTLVRRFTLVALLGLAPIGPLLAATYFVNSNGGNDSYNGSMPAWTNGSNGPWQTLAKLAAARLAPNDTVYLACGGVWNETLKVPSSGAAGVPITITGGPGYCATPPLIDGAVTVPSHQWVRHSGSIFRAKLPADLIANSNPGSDLAGWAHWSSSGDTSLTIDTACPAQTTPCMAFTSGTSLSLVNSNIFALGGGVEYTAGLQLRAPAGTSVKVVVRRGGPTYERLAPDEWVTTVGNAWQSVGFVFRAGATVPNARLDIEVPGSRIRVNLREAHVRKSSSNGEVIAAFVDGFQIRRAHHPNFGAGGDADSPYAAVSTNGGKTTLDTTGLPLPTGAVLSSGLGATIRTINWAIEERAVAAVSGRRLTLDSPTDYEIQSGYGYFLTGALWMLDSPGEWYYDKNTSTLFAWMPDGSPPGDRVSVSSLGAGVDVAGKANVSLRKINVRRVATGIKAGWGRAVAFVDMSITDTADIGINGENCAECSVQSSRLNRTGQDAVFLPGALAAGFSLVDSTIQFSGASSRTDAWRGLPRPSRAAVYSPGSRASILRNSIDYAANVGVLIGPDSVVNDNYVANACRNLNDCGGIYANFAGNRASINGNIVEGVRGNLAGVPGSPQFQTAGIYLDDRNANSVVSGNTVIGAEYGIHLHDASGVTVSNNLLFGNRRHQIWLQEHTRLVRDSGDIFGNTITANTLVPTASGPALYLDSEVTGTLDFGVFYGNHYSALFSPRVLGQRDPTSASSFTVDAWQAAGRETNAHVTQPVGYVSFLADSINLIPNGNLASGLTGWTSWNQTPPKATMALLSCGFAPCVELRPGSTVSLLSSWHFSVVGGQWYRVSFDAATSYEGQPISAVVRRSGGGNVGYEFLMPALESFNGSTSWRRYSFTFQALKSVTAADPLTHEWGARVDFERNQPGTTLKVARLEMVKLTPAQAPLQVKLLLNRSRNAATVDCESLGVIAAHCGSLVYLSDNSPVPWPAQIGPFSANAIYTLDTTLTDSDRDGIADQQDVCPNTLPGMAVNARGCAFHQ